MKIKKLCNSTIQFGDDYGDNHCTFHCQLEEGHSGSHIEIGNMFYLPEEDYPYKLEWNGDMTEMRVEDNETDLK
jgi:hypothetical protein